MKSNWKANSGYCINLKILLTRRVLAVDGRPHLIKELWSWNSMLTLQGLALMHMDFRPCPIKSIKFDLLNFKLKNWHILSDPLSSLLLFEENIGINSILDRHRHPVIPWRLFKAAEVILVTLRNEGGELGRNKRCDAQKKIITNTDSHAYALCIITSLSVLR